MDLIAERINIDIAAHSVRASAMYFEGSACGDGCGIGILLVSPRGATYSFSIRLPTTCTNNLAEYEVIRKSMELFLETGAEAVEIFGDSKLVISQLTEKYRCESKLLFPLWVQCQELMAQFRYINFYCIPWIQNSEANDLAQRLQVWQIEPIFRYTCRNKETGELISSITLRIWLGGGGHLRGYVTRP
jgi:ribonuclease HI